MNRTGLTEQEMESLLKWFLTNGNIGIGESKPFWSNYKKRIEFTEFDKPIAKLIVKAMDNLSGIR